MKFDRNKAFPYPVLRPYNDDFIDKDFQAAVSVEVSESSVNISIDYSLSSKSIKKLIDAHEASFVTVVSCRDTYFSQAIESFDEHAEKVLSHGIFRGEVFINKYIQILDDISFESTEVHPDFGTGPFLYTKGDVIAQDEPEKFYFGREFFKPLTSIFSLVKNESLSYGEWKIDTESDYVSIEINPKMKEKIDIARSGRSNQMILINSLYYAAVVQVIENLKEDDSSYSDYRWAQVIAKKMGDCEVTIDDPSTKIASKILDYPLRMLSDFVFADGAES